MRADVRFRVFPRLVQGKWSHLPSGKFHFKKVFIVPRSFIPEKPCGGDEQGEEN